MWLESGLGAGVFRQVEPPAVEKQCPAQSTVQGLEPVTEMEDADSRVKACAFQQIATCLLRCMCATQLTQLDTVTLGCQPIPLDGFDLYEHKHS